MRHLPPVEWIVGGSVLLWVAVVLVAWSDPGAQAQSAPFTAVPTSGNVPWDAGVLSLVNDKVSELGGRAALFDTSRSTGLIAIPRSSNPPVAVDELQKGHIVGALYAPSLLFSRRPLYGVNRGIYEVHVRGEKGKLVASLRLGDKAIVDGLAVTIDKPPNRLERPVALVGYASHVCFAWESIMICI